MSSTFGVLTFLERIEILKMYIYITVINKSKILFNSLQIFSCLFSFLPESFRWLVSHGRLEEAEHSIRFVAKINGRPAPDLNRLKTMIQKEQEAAKETKALQVYTVLDLFRTSKIRKTTVLFAFVWWV